MGGVVAAAKKAIAAAELPTKVWQGPTDHLTPPKGVKIGIVECSSVVNGCVTPADGAVVAANALGWVAKIYDGLGTPAGQNAAVISALAAGAEAVLLVGVDPTAIKSSLQEAASRHAPVGDLGDSYAPGNGLTFSVGANYPADGVLEGEWIVAASNGKAVVLPTNDKEYIATVQLTDAAVQYLKACTTCKVLPQQYFVSTSIGNGLGQRIASVLETNPTVDYIVGAYDPAVEDMVPAIESAGLAKRVSIVSNVGSPANLVYISKGLVQKADIVFDNNYMGWAGVDQVVRLLLHKPLWKSPGVTNPGIMYSENTPSHFVVKSNLPPAGTAWKASFNTAALYESVWGLKK
jgi:ABC-type sugar transport system substrate-binding protein